MNCRESGELLQRLLDGDPGARFRADLEQHLEVCTPCRELHGAAHCLIEGLELTPVISPAPGSARRISLAILADYQRRRRVRRILVPAALAASLLLALLAWRQPQSVDSTEVANSPGGPIELAAEPAVPLHRSVENASLAVVNITRRAADQTVGESRRLLPSVLPDTTSMALPVRELLEPTAKPLQDIGDSMTAGLEPVTSSARRMVDMFMKEFQTSEADGKSGL